jgi:hypothetical protein
MTKAGHVNARIAARISQAASAFVLAGNVFHPGRSLEFSVLATTRVVANK